MILDPINDEECLGQLTVIMRELSQTTLIRQVAKRIGTRQAVIEWLQSLPQANDDGSEAYRMIMCDVPQRVRLLPDDPNCVERSMGAGMLLEALDPKTPRVLATVDKPLRHTGMLEKSGDHWRAIDLFPRRNASRNAFDWGKFGTDVVHGIHTYVGKPVLTFYLGDKAGGTTADYIGKGEDWALAGGKSRPNEKKNQPPSGASGAQRPSEQSKQQPKQQQSKQQPAPKAQQQQSKRFDFSQLVGSGAKQESGFPIGGGGKDAEEEKGSRGASPFDGARKSSEGAQAEEGGDRDPYDARAQARRFWRQFGR